MPAFVLRYYPHRVFFFFFLILFLVSVAVLTFYDAVAKIGPGLFLLALLIHSLFLIERFKQMEPCIAHMSRRSSLAPTLKKWIHTWDREEANVARGLSHCSSQWATRSGWLHPNTPAHIFNIRIKVWSFMLTFVSPRWLLCLSVSRREKQSKSEL